uniref:Peptidase M16C associated domain-containing protein n=1 Tax=Corethron hystrix TaxID=216773 RepID=A0A7S1FV17_9STRA|mmetsp:Transcript_31658/g.72583  ORF Transcript_31658/g.72583 Transcript_31658/m.72583 type:complete len:1142 (+) Transcript_31658:358-3783(+)
MTSCVGTSRRRHPARNRRMCAFALSIVTTSSSSFSRTILTNALSFTAGPTKSGTATRSFATGLQGLYPRRRQFDVKGSVSHSSLSSSRPVFRHNYSSFGLGRLSSSNAGVSIARHSAVLSEDVFTEQMAVTHDSFEVVKKDIVDEYGAYCTLYRHKQTGAEILSVSTDDDNKVFGITFRTPPSDSTGVPHILEHSVLCGSKKFPTKDPFVELIQGSLNTFLNAFTYPDRTCYPVASQNKKDFYNLVNVYLDAVLNPRCVNDPMVLAQEGWHLELENKEDPLTYKGVVYNEMKGVYSSSDSLLTRESMRSLFPDTTYGVDSGGDPTVIPDLTFEQFAGFHSKFYHPANSRIFFYGDDPVEDRLQILDEYLSEFDASPQSKPDSEVAWQKKRFTEPQYQKHPYPAGADQPATHMICVNWLLNEEPISAYEELAWALLDHLLVGTSSSTLYRELMESGLGESITGGGLSDELLQGTFSMGLKGVQPENVEKVEALVLKVLEKVADEGFAEDDIAASMNTVEFSLREFNTGSFPKGLSFMLGAMSKWLYEKSPTEALKFEEPLVELKASIAADGSKVFQDLIRKKLLENNHRVTVEMIPSKTLEAEELKEEKDRLEAIKEKLSVEEIENIIETTKELKRLQLAEDPPEAVATIPALQLDDLDKKTREYPIEIEENAFGSGSKVVRHELGSTSGIAYVDFGVDISSVPLSEVPILSVLTRLMMEAGTSDLSNVELRRQIGTHTGGIGVEMLKVPIESEGAEEFEVADGTRIMTKIFIKGKVTSDKTDELFGLMKTVLTDTNIGDAQKKVIEILKETRSSKESQIQGAGHSYANMRIQSRYSHSGAIDEMLSGVTSLQTTKDLLKLAEEDWPSFLARLDDVRKSILNDSFRSGVILNLTGDKKVLTDIEPSVESFLGSLPGSAGGEKLPNFDSIEHPWVVQSKEMNSLTIEDEGFIVPTQVSYVGKGGRLYEPGEKVSGAALVASRYLRSTYMWDTIRVVGGAYGGMCNFDSKGGLFTFLSYRDPNLASTLDAYDAAADALASSAEQLAQRPELLSKAIIGMVGELDKALSPDQKGWVSLVRHLGGESPETRQKRRDQILNTSADDFRDFASRLKNLKDASVAVVSSKGGFEAAAEAGKDMKLTELV